MLEWLSSIHLCDTKSKFCTSTQRFKLDQSVQIKHDLPLTAKWCQKILEWPNIVDYNRGMQEVHTFRRYAMTHQQLWSMRRQMRGSEWQSIEYWPIHVSCTPIHIAPVMQLVRSILATGSGPYLVRQSYEAIHYLVLIRPRAVMIRHGRTRRVIAAAL